MNRSRRRNSVVNIRSRRTWESQARWMGCVTRDRHMSCHRANRGFGTEKIRDKAGDYLKTHKSDSVA